MNAIFRKVFKLANRCHNLEFISKRTCTNQPKSPSKSPKKTQSTTSPPPPPSSPSSPSLPKEVPGLSENIVKIPASEVGPGASKKSVYKNPEYFCYNVTSYFEAEVEMMKYRLPQPSNKSVAKP